jgi:hypothetical protein
MLKLTDLQNHPHTAEVVPLKEELGRATNAEHIRWRRTQQCIQKVAEGLRAMPEMDAATAAALTPQVQHPHHLLPKTLVIQHLTVCPNRLQPSPHNKKVLLEAAQRLERDVLVPLNELAQTTLFSYEMVQETYRSQHEFLEGASAGSTGAGSGALSQQGVRKLLHSLEEGHGAQIQRLNKIQEKFSAQKDLAERLLTCAISQRNKVRHRALCGSYSLRVSTHWWY